MSLRPKTIKLPLVPLILSRSHLLHQQIRLAIHLKYASTTLPTLPLPPLTHCWHLVRPGAPRPTVPASQLLSRLPFPPLPPDYSAHTCSVKRTVTSHRSPARDLFAASQHKKNKSQGLNHDLRRPWLTWLPAPLLRPTLLCAPAMLPFSLFSDFSGMVQPEVFALSLSSA